MNRFVLGFAALLALGGPVLAADAPPPISLPTLNAHPSPEQLAAARDVLEAANSRQMMSLMMNTLLTAELTQAKKRNPNVSDAAIATLTKALEDEFDANSDQLMDIFAALYAEHFSVDELHQISAFYRSDVGRKLIATTPAMLKEMSPLAMEWGQQLAARVIARVDADLKKHGDSL